MKQILFALILGLFFAGSALAQGPGGGGDPPVIYPCWSGDTPQAELTHHEEVIGGVTYIQDVIVFVDWLYKDESNDIRVTFTVETMTPPAVSDTQTETFVMAGAGQGVWSALVNFSTSATDPYLTGLPHDTFGYCWNISVESKVGSVWVSEPTLSCSGVLFHE